MARIAFVAESSVQQKGSTQAEHLYRSTLFQRRRSYAIKTCSAWYILSTQHRLLKPDTVIQPYDTTLRHLDDTARFNWAQVVLQLMFQLSIKTYDTLIFLANPAYLHHLVPVLQARRYEIETPLAGMNVVKQIQWLTEVTQP
ncbi:MAG: hypothetical protein H6673_02110 [Anaerolineales bacterium]|nr:hypothetical protein [Anaerolineales bacterium]